MSNYSQITINGGNFGYIPNNPIYLKNFINSPEENSVNSSYFDGNQQGASDLRFNIKKFAETKRSTLIEVTNKMTEIFQSSTEPTTISDLSEQLGTSLSSMIRSSDLAEIKVGEALLQTVFNEAVNRSAAYHEMNHFLSTGISGEDFDPSFNAKLEADKKGDPILEGLLRALTTEKKKSLLKKTKTLRCSYKDQNRGFIYSKAAGGKFTFDKAATANLYSDIEKGENKFNFYSPGSYSGDDCKAIPLNDSLYERDVYNKGALKEIVDPNQLAQDRMMSSSSSTKNENRQSQNCDLPEVKEFIKSSLCPLVLISSSKKGRLLYGHFIHGFDPPQKSKNKNYCMTIQLRLKVSGGRLVVPSNPEIEIGTRLYVGPNPPSRSSITFNELNEFVTREKLCSTSESTQSPTTDEHVK
jgi:hypothetical protein